MKPFECSELLQKAAQDHVEDVGPKGLVSSIGSNGTLPTDRIGKYGNIDETWAESAIFGGLDAKEVVERLIVCDGQPTRGFRKTLYNDQLNFCGVSTGLHQSHDNLIQLEYVKGLLQDGEAPSINVQVTEELTSEILEKFEKMGIDSNKIKICHDPRSTAQKVQSLITGSVTPAKV